MTMNSLICCLKEQNIDQVIIVGSTFVPNKCGVMRRPELDSTITIKGMEFYSLQLRMRLNEQGIN